MGKAAKEGVTKIAVSKETWAELQRLRAELISKDPSKRWTMDEVIRHLLSLRAGGLGGEKRGP